MTDAEVIAEYTAYIDGFVAKRRRLTGGLPLCPFALAARRSGNITYHVGPLSYGTALRFAAAWTGAARSDETGILLDPNRTLPIAELRAILPPLRAALWPLGWIAFAGHPDDGWTMGGVETRRDPFPAIRIYHTGYLKAGELALEAGGRYYSRVNPDELEEWEHAT